MIEPITKKLANFACQLNFEDIPPNVVTHMKRCLLDNVGCGLFGSTVPWSCMVRGVAEDCNGKPEATVWGTNLKVPCTYAAMANGIAINAFEVDDTHLAALLHPGCIVSAAGFAVAEREGTNGKDFLTAVIAGFESSIRTCLAMGISHFTGIGRYTPPIGGITGAAVVAGKLLGLSEEELTYAIHIAAAQVGGLFSRSMVKRFCNARSAEGGVIAALLAKKGYKGIDNILEAEHGGLLNAFSDAPQPERVTQGLGKDYHVLDVGFKPYSAGWPIFTTVDAVKQLRERHRIDPDAVEKIKVVASTLTQVAAGAFYEQYDTNSALHTIPYCAAVTLIEGDCFVDQFTEEKYRDAKILNLARKINVVANPDWDTEDKRWTANVEIRLKDGQSYSTEVQWSKGSHKNPQTDEELRRKFNRLAGKVLNTEKVNQLAEIMGNIEQVGDIRTVTALLVP